jgi:hypothetical protein
MTYYKTRHHKRLHMNNATHKKKELQAFFLIILPYIMLLRTI